MSALYVDDELWERMSRAVELAQRRLQRTVAALNGAGIPYAIAGECATAAWVSRIDEAAVRNTRDVDVVLRREDLPLAKEALAQAGFEWQGSHQRARFLDLPSSKLAAAVHLHFANESTAGEALPPAPDIAEVDKAGEFPVLTLDALVRLLLTNHRRLDRLCVRDLIDVGLVDNSHSRRHVPEITVRLQALLNDPDG